MGCKVVSIVYNQPLTQVQGINYVNNSFVVGSSFFRQRGIILDKIYGPDMAFDCTCHNRLDVIGANSGTKNYQRKRKIRVLLRRIFSSNCFIGAWIKLFVNYTINAKKTIKRLDYDHSDYLIFQDITSVREYYKRFGNRRNVKTILILHCSNHPLEQIIFTFPGYYNKPFFKRRAYKECEKSIASVDKVVYLSQHAKEVSSVDAERKTFIYNGIEDLSISIHSPSLPLQLVCVASVTYHKGQLNIVEALSMLDPTTLSKLHLTIVGGGNEYEECQKLVKEKRLENVITMTGQRDDVFDILKTMDVFILPSKSEGMPISILEAMRQGLFIMATPVGGIPEMIEDSYGEFISREPKMLSQSIKQLIDKNIVTLMSKQKARNRFMSDFTLEKMIDNYSNVIKSL